MNDTLDALLEKMRLLEKEIVRELQGKETEFLYEVRQRKVRFTEEARARSRPLVKRLTGHIHESRFVMKSMHSRYWTFFDYGDAEH